MISKQIDAFNRSNTEGLHFDVSIVKQKDSNISIPVKTEDLADLFFFNSHQLNALAACDALTPLGDSMTKEISSRNDEISVKSATYDGRLLAFPVCCSNGILMYYDKAVVPEEHVDSMEAIIRDCEAADRTISFDLESGWYNASWFFATGCVSEWKMDERGEFISVRDTYNSDCGLAALRGMKRLLDSPTFDNSSTASSFASGSAVVVSGNWDYAQAKSNLGDNLGITDLPSFSVDGKEYHLSSFYGSMLLGIKPQEDARKYDALEQLALYLSGDKCQNDNYHELGYIPTNRELQSSDEICSDPVAAAMLRQAEFSVPQRTVKGAWWDFAGALVRDAETANNEEALKAALDSYDKIIKNSIAAEEGTNSADETTYGVIGNFTSWGEISDLPMTDEDGDQVFESEPIFLHAGDELKVRANGSWEKNYGSDSEGTNIVVSSDGYYIVRLDLNTGIVSLLQ